jgi:hypothetical protein
MHLLAVTLSAAIAVPEPFQIHSKSRAHQALPSPLLPAVLTQARYTNQGKEVQLLRKKKLRAPSSNSKCKA